MLDSLINPVCDVFGCGSTSAPRRKKKTRARRTYVTASRPRTRRAAAPRSGRKKSSRPAARRY